MEVRAGGTTGATAETDFLTTFYVLALFHLELGEMKVESEQSLAVVDDDAIAFEVEEACEEDSACVHGSDRCSCGDAEIESLVLALGLTVENALRTVDVGCGGVGGSGEVPIPLAIGSDTAQIVLLDLHAFCDLRLLLGIRLGELFWNGEFHLNLRIIKVGYSERTREGQRSFASCTLGGQFEGVFARFCVEGDACQGEPGFSGGVVTEGELVCEPRAGEGFEFSWRLYLKQDWSAVHQASGLGACGPGGGGGGEGGKDEKKDPVEPVCSDSLGYAYAGRLRPSPHEQG